LSQSNFEDQLMKEAIKKELDASPAPPLTSSEAWEQISMQLSHPRNNIRPRRIMITVRRISLTASLFLVVILTSLLLAQEGSAMNWLSKYWISMKGTITSIIISNTDQQSELSTNQPQSPTITDDDIHESLVHTEQMTLTEAQAVSSFKIAVPLVVPDGYTLSHVQVYFRGEGISREIELIYKSNNSEFSIREYMLSESYNSSIGIDHEDTQRKEVWINGEEGTLLIYKSATSSLMWNNRTMQFIVNSSLTEDELITMVKTM
jgi:hypothetical protein